MSKELEAFKEILDILSSVYGCEIDMNSETIKTIQNGLQRLESIDNSNPSEALECLERLARFVNPSSEDGYRFDQYKEDYNCIQQTLLRLDHLDDVMDLLPNRFSCIKNREIIVMRKEMFEKYQEQEKVLKIIINKKVDTRVLRNCIKMKDETPKDYNILLGDKRQLTQEEFDTLKRYCDEQNN